MNAIMIETRNAIIGMNMEIDTSFDVYSDTPAGMDPDSYSRTLRSYHKMLWSKPLPNGSAFYLSDSRPGTYLYHKSELGEFFLSSDSFGHTYRYVKAMAPIIDRIPEDELTRFFSICSTVGAYILFPSRQVERKPTINQARGMHGKIRDRFDLSLECIRRHYDNQSSPLSETLARYAYFFDLFGNFRGYVQFFLLQDFVSDDGTSINFLLPFTDFDAMPLPSDVHEYRSYRDRLVESVIARNRRIETLAA
ncbi:hypothetical protein MB818_21730 [Ruegeria sp. 1NDH52C]|uniref:Uncharacterized protein n=1 Tax=Ruegeria alba TaxID=2916756 RepID=A0ABS9P2V5_9RHOB|nr:hypothetical protein [Ruegeria alba]MCG6560827.1 hypothetical protein [Ruegeria alba]